MLNESQIGDIWMLFSDFMDKKQVEAAAERYVDLLADYGVTDRVMSAATGVDPVLDQAIDYYLDEPDAADDEEDDDYKELEF
jgi:cytosine/adenosine deaminase-related metal-dependent hydrolase